jgi:iron complex outermembrane recepter protein
MTRACVTSLRRAGATAFLASTMLATSGAAFAQDAAATVDTGEIIVTATKREESLQKVPISLQALGNATLDQHQVKSFDDYAKLLPSVSYQTYGPGQSDVSFRGVATGGINLPGGSLPTAGVYIDEIPVTTIGALVDIHSYDMARVEALSGPQGTLFGASSLAGTLRIITNKPNTSKFEAGYDLQLNKFGKGNAGGVAEAFVNAPLSDSAALRVVGFYQKDGGYIDNTFKSRTYQRLQTVLDGNGDPVLDGNGDPVTVANPGTFTNAAFVKKDFNSVETYGGRAALGIDLDDNWTVTPAVIAQHQLAKGTFGIDPRAGDLDVHEFAPDRNLDKWYLATMTIKGKLSDFDVTYAGGYFQRSIDNQQDYSYYTVYYDNIRDYTAFSGGNGGFLDPTQRYINTQRMVKQSHELRISSPSENPFRATVGLFYQRQRNNNIAHYTIPGLAAGGNTTVFGDDVFITDTHIVARDYAAFGEASFDITPDIILTAGIRGFKARNSLYGFSGFASNADPGGAAQEVGQPAGSGCTVPITLGQCYNVDKVYKESGETHKINLTWQVDPSKMVYVTYSTGFRPGGNNRRPGIDAYDADTIDNFEFGWKTSWLDRMLRINGAVFYQEWNKLQYTLAPVGAVGVVNIYNAGDARIYGIEMDVQLRTGGFTLSAAGSYTDAKLSTDFCNIGTDGNQLPSCSLATDVAAPKGTRLPVQPKFKVNSTLRYDFGLGGHDSFVQASMLSQTGVRNFLGLADNDAVGNTKGFTTFDFSGGIKFGELSFSAFIQNAFDKRGILSRNTFCAPTYCGTNARSYPVKPQLFGLKVSQRF